MNQYIITEEQLQRGQEFMSKTGRKKYEKEIRSHPYQGERDTCPQNKIWQHCPAVEQIRKDARDKVLDDIDKKLKQYQMQWACDFWSDSTVSEIKDMLKELRQQAGEP
jgi:hypothetical protein